MVSALDSGSGGPGLSPGQGLCTVLLGKTLNSHSASLHPSILMSTVYTPKELTLNSLSFKNIFFIS